MLADRWPSVCHQPPGAGADGLDDGMMGGPSSERTPEMAVKPIPGNYPKICAYLIVEGANDAIEFYKKVLGAEERIRMDGPNGRVGHAELQFGDSVVMLADAYPEMDIRDPKTIGGTPVSMTIYVEDVDSTFADALAAGAAEVQPVEDKFYGDRAGQ